jgi:tetratricopeptide (TPR) repeat protein
MPKKRNGDIQFGDRDADGKAVFYDLAGLSFAVQHDNGDGWVRVRARAHDGWVGKNELVLREEAVAHFEKLAKANPQDTFALFMIAATHQELGKHDAAIEAYAAYITVNPSDRAAYNNRALMLVGRKEFDKAIADYDQAVKLGPDVANTYANRAAAWLGKKEYEKAVADCDKALELDPKAASAAVNKGRALVYLKKYAEAGKSFETAIKLEPTTGRYNSYAWVLATCPDENGRDGKKAVELATKAVEKAGKGANWTYVDTLAAAHAEAGDFEKAVAEQQKALADKTIPADERKKMEARLELYKAKKPYRDDE